MASQNDEETDLVSNDHVQHANHDQLLGIDHDRVLGRKPLMHAYSHIVKMMDAYSDRTPDRQSLAHPVCCANRCSGHHGGQAGRLVHPEAVANPDPGRQPFEV